MTHGLSQQHALQQRRLTLQGTHGCSDVPTANASAQQNLAHPSPHTLAPYLLSLGSRGASDGLGRGQSGQVSRAARGCSPSSWLGILDKAALHSPALGLHHPLALPWDQQAPKVLVSPARSSTALSLRCRQPG